MRTERKLAAQQVHGESAKKDYKHLKYFDAGESIEDSEEIKDEQISRNIIESLTSYNSRATERTNNYVSSSLTKRTDDSNF